MIQRRIDSTQRRQVNQYSTSGQSTRRSEEDNRSQHKKASEKPKKKKKLPVTTGTVQWHIYSSPPPSSSSEESDSDNAPPSSSNSQALDSDDDLESEAGTTFYTPGESLSSTLNEAAEQTPLPTMSQEKGEGEIDTVATPQGAEQGNKAEVTPLVEAIPSVEVTPPVESITPEVSDRDKSSSAEGVSDFDMSQPNQNLSLPLAMRRPKRHQREPDRFHPYN